MRAATAAVTRLEARLGPYPYRILTIVQTAGGYGMEGPGVVWIPTGVGSANLTYLVTHEIAHQWFYGIVGNDQAREPFADEAAADFVARDVLGMRRASRCSTSALDRTIYRYSSACYYEVVYIQGGNLLASAPDEDGIHAFLGRDPGVPRGPPVGSRPYADAARCPRRRHRRWTSARGGVTASRTSTERGPHRGGRAPAPRDPGRRPRLRRRLRPVRDRTR